MKEDEDSRTATEQTPKDPQAESVKLSTHPLLAAGRVLGLKSIYMDLQLLQSP